MLRGGTGTVNTLRSEEIVVIDEEQHRFYLKKETKERLYIYFILFFSNEKLRLVKENAASGVYNNDQSSLFLYRYHSPLIIRLTRVTFSFVKRISIVSVTSRSTV